MATPAQAWVIPGPLAGTLGCAAQAALPLSASAIAAPESATKSVAILGGQLSALDMITQQQQAMPVQASNPQPAAMPTALAQDNERACRLAASDTLLPAQAMANPPLSREDFLGSKRIMIGKTPFDDAWRRVSRRSLARARVSDMLGNPASEGLELVALVNGWVNRHIEYARDARLYGASDFWASAGQTLKAGKGDCEDFVILKYQMLAALGIAREQMSLTITRDLVRNEDHTVLIVKLDEGYFMLDNATSTVLPANLSHDYRAVMTLSSQGSWVHGFTNAPRVAALGMQSKNYFSESAVSSARVTGFNK